MQLIDLITLLAKVISLSVEIFFTETRHGKYTIHKVGLSYFYFSSLYIGLKHYRYFIGTF